MATKDFKIRHSLTVAQNATIEGNLTLGGKTVSRLIDSDEVTTIISSSVTGLADSDLKAIADLRNDVDSDSIKIQSLSTTVSGLSGGGTSNIISPVAFAFVNTTANSSGTNISWSNWNAGSATLDFTFTTAQPDTNYAVITDADSFDDYNVSISSKTTSGFSASFYDDTGGNRTPSSAAPFTFLIYGSNPNVLISGVADAGFDSDQVVAIINENVVVDTNITTRLDSDEIKIQAINTELTGLELEILGVDADLNAKIDSDSARIDALAAAGVGLTTFAQVVHTFTTTQPTTIFTGADDDGNTLSYTVGKLQVYLNGLLLTPGASKDYTATNGTSVVLTEASDSEDVITIVKYLGAADDILTQKYVYKVASSGNHTPFDSEFTGADENGNVLSYTPNKVQVFLNGILLQDSDDYIANNGSTITLLAAPDSDDVLVVYRYLGTQVTGFDSDQVLAIINENASTLPWVEKTSSTSITAGQKVIVDTSTAVTLTLPSSASLGDEIRIIDGTGNAATNNITVARNGHNIMGDASDLIINLNAAGIGLVYYNASRGWILIEI